MQADRKCDGVTIVGIILKLNVSILLDDLFFKLYYSAFSLYSCFIDEVVELAPNRSRYWKDDIPSKGVKHRWMEPSFFSNNF